LPFASLKVDCISLCSMRQQCLNDLIVIGAVTFV